MKRNNILKWAGVLLIAVVMILSTVAVSADTDNTWKISKNIENKNPILRDDILNESWDNGIPGDWTQELVAGAEPYYWDKYYGGWFWDPPGEKHPEAPHTEPWNVMFEPTTGPEGAITKLITPSMDLSTVTEPKLNFWYAIAEDPTVQPAHTGQEIITVYYKTSSGGSWTPVPNGHFEDDTPEWTETTLDLPDPSADYYIAFEGEYHWGYGACIDDVRVFEGLSGPIVDAGGPYEGVVGEGIQFTGSATGGTPTYTWHWDFGNGDTADEQNPVYAYNEAGVYDVTLTVTDSLMNTGDDMTTATITGPELDIGVITGGLFKVKAVINNDGAAATGVNWKITLDGGAFIGKETNGEDLSIAAGGSETVTSGLIVGFGSTTVTVETWIPDGPSDTREQDGFVFLIFIKVNPGGGI